MNKMLYKWLAIFCFAANAQASPQCSSDNSTSIDVTVHLQHVVRAKVPASIFGFNVPWYAFQEGLQEKGIAKPELVKLLKPFSGALYRFPGGAPSNSYDWENSVRPVSQRVPMHYEYGNYFIPEFGYDEFFKFVKQVDGHAIVTLNLVGPYPDSSSSEQVAADAKKFVDWILNYSSAGCIGGVSCPITYLELGNELDWTPYLWSSVNYVERANEVITMLGDQVPANVWIVHGKSAPWDQNHKQEGHVKFNKNLAERLPKSIVNLAYHPYYDGNSIPETMKYADSFYQEWQQGRKTASLIMTEHARWPHVPSVGQWKDYWFEATGQSGAISSADFILTVLPDSRINGAVWHSLGTLGPWQLIRWDKTKDELYPSPVYWGMLTLREAFLQDAIEITPNLMPGNQYIGGYDLRLVAMKGNSKVSLLGVNRSNKSTSIHVTWSGEPSRNKNGELRLSNVSANNLNELDDNDNTQKNRVVKKIMALKNVVVNHKSQLCIPAKTIFSLII